MSATFFIQECNNVSLSTSTLVSLWRLFVIFGEELDGREPGDFVFLANVGVLLVVSVKIGNDALHVCRLTYASCGAPRINLHRLRA